MPTYHYICETCEMPRKAWRPEGSPPRFCSRACAAIGKSGEGKGVKPVKYTITPEAHERIKRVYQTDSGNGQIAALARALGLPRWKITRHAIQQGWTQKQKKEPEWTDREIHILQINAHMALGGIQKRLKTSGFHRTIYGIQLKRRRLNMLKNLKGHTARSVAQCLGVDDHFVTRAIREGKLSAGRRGTDRTPQQGGDQWYIKDDDIRAYIVDNVHEIDLRKVDKYWFVDLMAN